MLPPTTPHLQSLMLCLKILRCMLSCRIARRSTGIGTCSFSPCQQWHYASVRRHPNSPGMSSNQVHPSEPNLSALEPDASVPTASHLLPARFCSLFTAQRVDSRAKLPGVAYRLQTQQRTGTATARTLHDTILNMADRHSRYQLLMNFRLHGSRFAAGLSVLFHLEFLTTGER